MLFYNNDSDFDRYIKCLQNVVQIRDCSSLLGENKDNYKNTTLIIMLQKETSVDPTPINPNPDDTKPDDKKDNTDDNTNNTTSNNEYIVPIIIVTSFVGLTIASLFIFIRFKKRK